MALIFRTFSALFNYALRPRGDVPTRRDLPLAIIFRAFGAVQFGFRLSEHSQKDQRVARTISAT